MSFKVMEGTVQYEGSGDVFFAFYNGDEQLTKMPLKNNEDNLIFDKGICDKGAIIEWDRDKWGPFVANLTENKTKCTLYFREKNTADYVEELAYNGTSQLAYDNTADSNLRYIGRTVNNYIDIGDRETNGNKILWRIIGVMNNMTVINEDDSETTGQSLVKIIRADSIGNWSWDSSAKSVNGGCGVNEWSGADLMTTLNTGAYWNKTSGQCYNSSGDSQKACDFSSTGLTASVKDKLVKVRWNTGTLGEAYSSTVYNSNEKFNAKALYTAERSDNHGKKFCSGGSYCNDQVERHTTWDGFIGLMYPSDYGYAVGESVRTECITRTMYDWDGSSPNCRGNDWLLPTSSYKWTLTPLPYSYDAHTIFAVTSNGRLGYYGAYRDSEVSPVAYLKSSVKIKENSASDYGSKSNPFVLEGVS